MQSNPRYVVVDTLPDALMFPTKQNTPIATLNFRHRVLQPLEEKLGLTVPLTFQVLRRSHATMNQRRLKDVQAHSRPPQHCDHGEHLRARNPRERAGDGNAG